MKITNDVERCAEAFFDHLLGLPEVHERCVQAAWDAWYAQQIKLPYVWVLWDPDEQSTD